LRHRTIVENFGYLSALQAFTVLLPLLTIPFLIRVLGADNYGLVAYAMAIIQYFVIIVNFGFNITATRDVSIHRSDPQKLTEIVSSVLSIKVILFLISFVLLACAVFVIPFLRAHYLLYFFTMSVCLSEVLFPVWYFQGVERMRYITFINVISRTVFAACIFIFIRKPEHYLLVPIFNGTGALIGGIIALWIVFRNEKVHFAFQPMATLWFFIKDSAPLFLTRASAQVYVRTNIVVVGSVLGMAEAAYYDLALKVVNVLSMPFQTIKTAIFPKVSKDLNLGFVHKTIKVVLGLAVLGILFVQLFATPVMKLFLGEPSETAGIVLRLLSLTLAAIVMSGFFGEQLLIPFGHKKPYVRGMVSTALFYFIVLSALYLLNLLNLYSVVLMVVATEYFLAAYFFVVSRKNKLL